MNRIRKAVQIDTLKPVDDFVKITSSAVDTAAIFHQVKKVSFMWRPLTFRKSDEKNILTFWNDASQIKTFWSQLSWPEVDGSYSFIAKILDVITKNEIFKKHTPRPRITKNFALYKKLSTWFLNRICVGAQSFMRILLARKLRRWKSQPMKGIIFLMRWATTTCQTCFLQATLILSKNHVHSAHFFSFQLCLAINNIEKVAESMTPISEDLGMSTIIEQLAEKNGPSVADQCKRTLVTVMENANENINNKIIEILERVGLKVN